MNAAARLRHGERGLALIVAMLVAALAAAVAVSLASAQSQWMAHVAQRNDQVQAQSLALAGVQWARQILDADGRAGPLDHLGEPWALPLPATPVDNGSIDGHIVDAQGFFNVNNLASAAHASFERRRFSQLLTALKLPAALGAAIIDWVDPDNVAEPDGAEDAWYASLPDPGLAANAPASRIEELAAVRGMTPEAIATLARYTTALPVDTPVNVNTASAELLAASLGAVEPSTIAELIASRVARPFASLADFRERLPAGASMGDETMYAVGSRYFLITVHAHQGNTIAVAHALVHRTGGAWPAIVWQTVE